MRNIFLVPFTMLSIFSVSCHNGRTRGQLTNYMSSIERKSIVISAVSKSHKYYNEVADVAEYIQEMSVYIEILQ